MKALSLTLALLSLAITASAGVDLGASAGRTPYDAYMSPVKHVLGSLDGAASMEQVQKLMREGRNFRYSFTTPYVAALPSVTAQTHAGDCKAKALWLCDQLGDRNVRFVVGKARFGARLSHAWVLWKESASGRWFVLDCTNNSRAVAADSLPSSEYIPLYSWSKNGAYRHAATSIGMAAVAGKHVPVASGRNGLAMR